MTADDGRTSDRTGTADSAGGWVLSWAGEGDEALFEVTAAGAAARAVSTHAPALAADRVPSRIAAHDATLWGPEAEEESAKRLGWTTLHSSTRAILPELEALHAGLLAEGIDRVVLAGMGGSSLAPEVITRTAGVPLVVLDSTEPGQVRAALEGGDLARTVIVVSSKSGGTVETDSQRRVFEAAFTAAGLDATRHIVVVTDPGSPLEKASREAGYRAVFLADPEVGGRFSALSAFGIVPSALAGVDVGELLDEAASVAELLAEDAESNPAVVLGAALGGTDPLRDKLVIVDEGSGIVGLGDWAEQLIAESTGKNGTGLLPVVTTSPAGGPPELPPPPPTSWPSGSWPWRTSRPTTRPPPTTTSPPTPARATRSRSPVRSARSSSCGSTRRRSPGGCSASTRSTSPTWRAPRSPRAVCSTPPPSRSRPRSPTTASRSGRPRPAGRRRGRRGRRRGAARPARRRGYLAVMAYLDREAHGDLAGVRDALAARTGRPVTFGWGPRFLHSTGQLHKGGAPIGVYLLLTGEPARTSGSRTARSPSAGSSPPSRRATRSVLADQGRPVLRLHVTGDAALARLTTLLGARGEGA